MADLSKDQVIDYLSNLPVMEIAALVKELEGKWGVSAAAPVAAGAPESAGSAARRMRQAAAGRFPSPGRRRAAWPRPLTLQR